MREIKIKYGYSDGTNTFEKAFTLDEIEQGLQFDEISDSPLLKNYKIIYKREYTGLKDKNNVEIYEGDIVTHEDFKLPSEVTFERGCFRIHGFTIANFEAIHHMDKIQVIGNIYENQDLLNKI